MPTTPQLTANGYLVSPLQSGEARFDVEGNLLRPSGAIAISAEGVVRDANGAATGHRDQPLRAGAFSLTASDVNSTIPVSGVASTTVDPSILVSGFQAIELSLHAAGARTLVGAGGLTLVVVGGGAASVAAKGSSLVITRGSTPTEVFVSKIGA